MKQRELTLGILLFFLMSPRLALSQTALIDRGEGGRAVIKINIPVNMPRICGEPEDKISGVQYQYYESGNLYQKATCREGARHGLYEQFYEDGSLWTSAEFKNDKLDGRKFYYYPDGTLWQELNYARHVKDGLQKEYLTDGTLYRISHYKDGQLDGKMQYFYPDGTVKEDREFQLGQPVGDIMYFDEGGTPQIHKKEETQNERLDAGPLAGTGSGYQADVIPERKLLGGR